jgi:hypothetical protein
MWYGLFFMHKCVLLPILQQGERMKFTMDLADYQKDVCERIVAGTMSESQRKQAYWKLRRNPWLLLSGFFAPGNLLLRAWCLLDLLENRPKHARKINAMLYLLSYNGTMWAEGAYYWLYMREILDIWVQAFPFTCMQLDISGLINRIHGNMVALTFKRSDGVWCAAPYGDVRDDTDTTHYPLGYGYLQRGHDIPREISCGPVTMECLYGICPILGGTAETVTLRYIITARPIGLNQHIPKNNYTVYVINGSPDGYAYYAGNTEKYTVNGTYSLWRELADVFAWKRIVSLVQCRTIITNKRKSR